MGRKNYPITGQLSIAPAGALKFLADQTHGFTVGYFLSLLRSFQ
jgi:hypothetical protein